MKQILTLWCVLCLVGGVAEAGSDTRFMSLNQFEQKHRAAIVVPLDKSEQRAFNAKQRTTNCSVSTRSGMRLNRDVLTIQRKVSVAIPYQRNMQPPEAQVIAAQNNVSQGKGVLDLYGDATVDKNHPFNR